MLQVGQTRIIKRLMLFRLSTNSNDWHEGYDKCKDKFGMGLARIDSELEQKEITRMIKERTALNDGKLKDYWIGLSDYFTPGSLTWSLHQDQPSFTNWAYGEPSEELMSNNIGATCTFIPKDESTDTWQTSPCGQRDKSWICEREAGKTCPLGWTYFKAKKDVESCVLFVVNGLEYTTWWSARQYCASIGAELFVPESKTENDNLVKYFDEWKRAGVTQMWIGVSANENCDFRKSNGYPLDYEGWSGDEPKCTSDSDPQAGFQTNAAFYSDFYWLLEAINKSIIRPASI